MGVRLGLVHDAGHHIDWIRMYPNRNTSAIAVAHHGDPAPLTEMLGDLIDRPHPPGPAGPGGRRELPPRWGWDAQVPVRVTAYLEVAHSAEERAAYQLLAEHAASRRMAAGGGAGRAAADFVTTLLKKRMLSSPKAFHRDGGDPPAHDDRQGPAGRTRRRPASVRGVGPAREGERMGPRRHPDPAAAGRALEETAEDDAAYGQSEAEALSAVRGKAPVLSDHERDLLRWFGTWARQALLGELSAEIRPQCAAGAAIKRPGRKVVPDQEYAYALRELVEGTRGSMPSAREVVRQLSIGQDRALRLLATLSAAQNGSGR
jgi:hypothetical protein